MILHNQVAADGKWIFSTFQITKLEKMTKRKRVPTRSSSQIAQSQTTLESLEKIIKDDEEEETHDK